MMRVRLARRGQITLPKEIREKLGLREGDQLELEIQEDKLILKPIIMGRIVLRTVPAKEFSRLEGLVELGGDAFKDSEALYDN